MTKTDWLQSTMYAMQDISTSYLLLLVAILAITLWLLKELFSAGREGNLHEKYVLITGCDSGFGKATAIKLDEMGFKVLATCMTAEGEKSLTEACSRNLTTFRLDITKSEEVRAVYSEVQNLLPGNTGVWGVVNNAGIGQVGPIDWIPLEQFKYVADVCLWGLIDVTKTFLPLIKRAKGRIVNVTSIAGRTCLPYAVAYCIPKFGAEAFSDGLRRELAPFGVKVSIVEPGFFRTNLINPDNLRSQWSNLWEELDENLQNEYGEQFYQTCVKNMLVGLVDTCSSPHIYKVADVIVHALTSSRPKSRYVVGWDSKLLWIWLSWFPTRVGDAILNLLGEQALPQLTVPN